MSAKYDHKDTKQNYQNYMPGIMIFVLFIFIFIFCSHICTNLEEKYIRLKYDQSENIAFKDTLPFQNQSLLLHCSFLIASKLKHEWIKSLTKPKQFLGVFTQTKSPNSMAFPTGWLEGCADWKTPRNELFRQSFIRTNHTLNLTQSWCSVGRAIRDRYLRVADKTSSRTWQRYAP